MQTPARLARSFLVLSALALVAPSVARATTVLADQQLPDLVAESRRAVLADVVAVRYGYDERRLPSTWLRLRIAESIYGESPAPDGEDVEIKILGSPRSMPDGRRLFIDGTPHYRTGQRYVLLLLDDSRWGFTNTAGLMYGVFRIDGTESDDQRAVSLAGNRRALGPGGLASWLPEDALGRDGRQALSDATAPVPYPLLRRALVELFHGDGR